MAEKILYILGAGASAEAMPVIKTNPLNSKGAIALPIAFLRLADYLTPNTPNSIIKKHTHASFYRVIADELRNFSKESQDFTTIDTYAKYLYLQSRPNFERLKYVLSVYFALEQRHFNKLDKRYLVWLTSLLEHKMFPSNIKILTWNYDFQIELTAEKFIKESFTRQGIITEHSPPLIPYYPSLGDDFTVKHDHISLLHLNGIAGFYYLAKMNQHVFQENDLNSENNYLDRLMECENYSRLNFAWEKDKQDIPIKIIDSMAHDVTIIVVIGYSFPFFNREMDMQVYRALQQYGKVKKIYFQDPVRDGSFLRNQFGYSKDLPIEHIKDVDAFHIPFEL